MLSYFHAQRFLEEINTMKVPQEMKTGFSNMIDDFLKDLVQVTEVDF
jgi:hypothetical protein